MVQKRTFGKLISTTLCFILVGSQVNFLPAMAQYHGLGINIGLPSAPHNHINGNSFTDHFQQGSINTTSVGNSVLTHTVPNHNHIWNTNTISGQTTGTTGQNHIGEYHSGYTKNHSLYIDGGRNLSANHSGTNYRSVIGTAYFHHNSFNSQTAVSLVGDKSANGSLLGSLTLPSLFNLNLSSSQAVIQASNNVPVTITLGGFLSATGIMVGGVRETIMPGQMVTAAQYVAMQQVATTGSQTLVLSNHGTAISGLVTLAAGQVSSLSGIEDPKNVIIDTVGFTSSNPLNVSGTTQVLGSIYTLQQSANVTAALDSASLFVGTRGTISDSLGNQSLFNSIFGSNGLTIGVLGNLTNQGTISSTGTLSVSANQINNVSTSNRQAVINAANVNLYVTSGTVNNSGEIIANTGNVQFNAADNQNINIVNTGTVQALGDISVRDAAYAGNANLTLNGGNWLSENLNLNSGSGIVTANIGNVTGVINTNAAEAHVTAATQNLIIGDTKLSGDPSYFNTLGEVTIAGNLDFSGQDLAIVANTNIVTASGVGSIDTSSSTGNGGNITMIAGANFTSSGAASGNNDTTTTLTVTGGTSAGGYIDLNGNISGSGAAITSLTSTSSAVSGGGGNIILVAYGGTAGQSGKVSLPTAVTVTTGGSGSGNNGSVTVISGANVCRGINVGAINTIGGSGSGGAGGAITLATAAPSIFSTTGTMIIKNGSITNGASFVGLNSTSASIVAGALTSPGGFIGVEAGGSITTGAVISNGVGINGDGGYINLSVGAANANLQVNGNVSANGIGTGNGGTTNISYNGSNNPSGAFLIGASSATSNYVSGNISADSGSVGATGGHITVTSTIPGPISIINPGANLKPLNISLIGNVSANGAALGNINFNGSAVNVAGSGALTGVVNNSVYTAAVTYTVGSGNLTLGQISNASGNIALTNNATNGIIQATENINSAGTLNINTISTGSVLIAATTVVSAAQVTVTTATFTNNGSLTASRQALIIQGNGTNNALTVNLGVGSSLSGGSVVFNGIGALAGAITMVGGNGSITALGANQMVTFNGGTGAVNVNVNSIAVETIGQGGSVSLTVNNGQLSLGSWTTSVGAMSFKDTFATGGVQVYNSLASAGQLSITSGSTAGINVVAGDLLSGTGVALAAGTGGIALNGTASISANSATGNAGTISIVSTGGAINIGTGNITAQATGITGSGGSITINGLSFVAHNQINANAAKAGNGGSILISAVGATGDLTANNTFTLYAQGGTISGNGGTVSLSAGRNLTIASTASLNVGARAANGNGGNISLTAGAASTSGVLQVSQALSANGVGTGNGGTVSVSYNSVNPLVVGGMGGNPSISYIDGNISANAGVSGTTGGTVNVTEIGNGTLAVTLTGSILANGNTLGNINFTSPSGQAINVTGPGALTGVVNNNATAAAVTYIPGTGNLVLGSISNASGNILAFANPINGSVITTNNITSAGTLTFTSASTGSVTIANATTVSGTVVTINTSTLNLAGNAAVKARSGDLNILSNIAGNTLVVNAGNGSSLSGQDVNFNSAVNPGSVTMTGGNGSISTNNGNGLVNLNIGSGSATVSVNSISGIVTDPNANFGAPAAGNVSITVAGGQLTLGNFATGTGHSITALNTASSGTIITTETLKSEDIVTLTSGTAGSITIASGSLVTGNLGVNLNAPVDNINGSVLVTTGNLNLQSNGIVDSLTVNMGPNNSGLSQLIASDGNVTFNNTNSGAITITGGPTYGLISASSDVIMNGGTGAVNSNNEQIIGCIHVNGSSISITTAVGNLDFCLGINTSSTGGFGGAITIAANGGSINSGAITSNGSGVGNAAGGISLYGYTGINVGNINANGLNGAAGGVINISSPTDAIVGTYISTTGSGSSNGGFIRSNSLSLALSGQDSSGNSIDVNANGTGKGGNIRVLTTSATSFVVGNGSGTGNGTAGNISANGLEGGFTILRNYGAPGVPNQVINGQITSNGTVGSGGKVELEGHQPLGSAPLIVLFNGGLIQATNNANDLGRVGFNGGPGQNISLLGFGTVNGGLFVHAGNLNQWTLEFLSAPAGIITVSPGITITNNFATNGIVPTPPPPPPTPVISVPAFLIGQSPPFNPGPDLSKTATDYTPWGHFFYQQFTDEEHPHFKLGIAYKNELASIAGAKSYGHTFVGDEKNRLLSYGMTLNNSPVSNYLSIDKGNILVSPDKDIVVGTHEGEVNVSPGAIAFVMESGSDVVIYNLQQSLPKLVNVVVKGQKIYMSPGQMLVLTRQNVSDFEDIDADCHMVTYRGAQEIPLGTKEIKAFAAQYSIASAFIAVEPLQQLIASNDREDKAVLDKIVKSAVMLGDFTKAIDMQQLANLDRSGEDIHGPVDGAGAKAANANAEKILDSAKKMAGTKEPQFQ